MINHNHQKRLQKVIQRGVTHSDVDPNLLDQTVQLVAIRNIFGQERNEWNDALVVVKGLNLAKLYPCTCDPGLPLPHHRVHTDGLPWLIPNTVYRFVRGTHKGRPALVQAEPFNVLRLPAKEHPENLFPLRTWTNAMGINIHDADPQDKDHVNGWSMGCIAMKQDDGWQNFMGMIYAASWNGNPQTLYSLKLVEWQGLALEKTPVFTIPLDQ